jgi:multiple sugar transport system permease protein
VADLATALNRRVAGTRLRLADVPLRLAGMAVVVLWAAPFVWMVSTSLKPPGQVMTRNIEWLPRTVVFDN